MNKRAGLLKLARILGVIVHEVTTIPAEVCSRFVDVGYRDGEIWVAPHHHSSAGNLAHELSHWILATPEQRSTTNYKINGDDQLASDQEPDVVRLDVYLLCALVDRDEAESWAQCVQIDADDDEPFGEIVADGERAWLDFAEATLGQRIGVSELVGMASGHV